MDTPRQKDMRKCHKRNPSQIAADAAFFEYWAVRGKTCRQLAELIATVRPYTLSHQQVHYELVKLRKQWRQAALVDRNTAVAKELAGLQAQEDELWIAWERSKLDAQSQTVDRESVKIGKEKLKGTIIKEKTTTEGQSGEAAFMRLILEIRDQRRHLLGLDAETVIRDSRDPSNRITVSGQPAGPIVHLILPAGRAAGLMPTEPDQEPPSTPEKA